MLETPAGRRVPFSVREPLLSTLTGGWEVPLGPSSVTDELVKTELDSDGEGVPGAELDDADSEGVDEEA